MHRPDAPTQRDPRAIRWFIAALFVIQAMYAGLEILPSVSSGRLLDVALAVAFAAYAAMVVAFVYGVWRALDWAWPLGVAVAIVGLGLAAVRILAGADLQQHLIGMVIDAGLLWYLQKSSIKATFGR
ncbi:MAG TPA: hypothetical protein VFI69_11610 [Candidatus Limnocylindrales bacterium]|jgi:hypothetical protein|nr:hypothetical protein [Candidatus Limnocylindrales bacterium]